GTRCRHGSVPFRVDDALALARNVVHVLRDLRAFHLPRAQPPTQLAHELGLVVPALHVALREHAPAGVAGQLPADLDAPVLHERAALALLAEAEAFERCEQVHAEAVVGSEY